MKPAITLLLCLTLAGCLPPPPGSEESERALNAEQAAREKKCGHMPEGNAKLCCEFPGMCR